MIIYPLILLNVYNSPPLVIRSVAWTFQRITCGFHCIYKQWYTLTCAMFSTCLFYVCDCYVLTPQCNFTCYGDNKVNLMPYALPSQLLRKIRLQKIVCSLYGQNCLRDFAIFIKFSGKIYKGMVIQTLLFHFQQTKNRSYKKHTNIAILTRISTKSAVVCQSVVQFSAKKHLGIVIIVDVKTHVNKNYLTYWYYFDTGRLLQTTDLILLTFGVKAQFAFSQYSILFGESRILLSIKDGIPQVAPWPPARMRQFMFLSTLSWPHANLRLGTLSLPRLFPERRMSRCGDKRVRSKKVSSVDILAR